MNMTKIINKPSGLILSDSLKELRIATDSEYITVTILTASAQLLYENTLYPYQGEALLYEARAVIEEYMRTASLSFGSVTVEVCEPNAEDIADSLTLRVLYCDRAAGDVSAPSLVGSRFLTERTARRVPPIFTDELSVLLSPGESATLNIRSTLRHKSTGRTYSGLLFQPLIAESGYQLRQVQINSADILTQAAHSADVPDSDLEIITVTADCGSRSLTYYTDRGLKSVGCFNYRNIFNAAELIWLPCEIVTNSELEQQTGVVDGENTAWDRTVKRSYTMKVGPLSYSEARCLDALLFSPAVAKVQADTLTARPVLVTDMSCEISDDPEEPHTAEFTWEYTDTRPVQIFSTPSRIFSTEFNSCFN